jgi:hypothetical protein
MFKIDPGICQEGHQQNKKKEDRMYGVLSEIRTGDLPNINQNLLASAEDKMSGVLSEIRTGDLPNINQNLLASANFFDTSRIKEWAAHVEG